MTATKVIIGYSAGTVGTLVRIGTYRDNLHIEPFTEILIILDITVDDKCSAFRKPLNKASERCTYVSKILEEIKMILLNIKNNVHCWIK